MTATARPDRDRPHHSIPTSCAAGSGFDSSSPKKPVACWQTKWGSARPSRSSAPCATPAPSTEYGRFACGGAGFPPRKLGSGDREVLPRAYIPSSITAPSARAVQPNYVQTDVVITSYETAIRDLSLAQDDSVARRGPRRGPEHPQSRHPTRPRQSSSIRRRGVLRRHRHSRSRIACATSGPSWTSSCPATSASFRPSKLAIHRQRRRRFIAGAARLAGYPPPSRSGSGQRPPTAYRHTGDPRTG